MKSFEQIIKDEHDLITKDFCYSSPFEIRSSIDLKEAEFVNRFQQTRTDGLMLLSGLNFPLPLSQGFEGNLKLQRSSQGLSKVKLMVSQIKELYKTTALMQHQMVQHGMFLKSKPQIGLSFTSDKINLETRLKGNPLIMDLSLTSQVQSYVMGLSLKLAVNSQKYTEYALALGKNTENFRILAKHCSNELAFGTFYIYQMIRFGKHTQAASIIRTRWASKDTHMQIAVRHENDDMMYKVKIDSLGRTAVVINKRINKLFDVSVSADVDLKEITSSRVGDYNLGVLINFKFQDLEKKLENLSSSCFSQDDSPQVLRTGKRIARDNSFDSLCHGLRRIDTLTPDRLRPHDHSSQDLFGSTTTNKLHHQAAKIPIETDSKQSANNTPIKSFIPKGRLAKLQSATPQPDANPESVVVKTFELTGLAVKDDELSIKQRCKGYHVVSIKADIDNVTGQCTGKAEVQVRTHLTQPELNSFKMKMVLQGLRVNEVQSKFGIKNNKLLANRDFLDPHLKDETGKIKGDCIKSFEKKIANLATSHDLFGGSSGVVKCIETLDSARDLKEIKETQASIRKWDSVRKLGNQKSKLARNNSSGYLKATISSQKKEKVIKG